MKRSSWIVTSFIVGLIGFVAAIVVIIGPRRLCEGVGGKWASMESSCVTRSCFGSSTCGKWANPSGRCDRLRIGDPRSEVHFQLGEPDESLRGGVERWHAGKGSTAVVVATFHDERLTSLVCPVPP